MRSAAGASTSGRGGSSSSSSCSSRWSPAAAAAPPRRACPPPRARLQPRPPTAAAAGGPPGGPASPRRRRVRLARGERAGGPGVGEERGERLRHQCFSLARSWAVAMGGGHPCALFHPSLTRSLCSHTTHTRTPQPQPPPIAAEPHGGSLLEKIDYSVSAASVLFLFSPSAGPRRRPANPLAKTRTPSPSPPPKDPPFCDQAVGQHPGHALGEERAMPVGRERVGRPPSRSLPPTPVLRHRPLNPLPFSLSSPYAVLPAAAADRHHGRVPVGPPGAAAGLHVGGRAGQGEAGEAGARVCAGGAPAWRGGQVPRSPDAWPERAWSGGCRGPRGGQLPSNRCPRPRGMSAGCLLPHLA